MSSMHQLWPIFVDDGGAYAGAMRDGIDRLVRDHAAGAPLLAATIDGLGDESHRLASVALLMGVGDVAELALACERGLDRLGHGDAAPELLLPILAGAAEALAGAFRALAAPDRSGARVAQEPLRAAQLELERFVGGSGARPHPDLSTTRIAANAARAAAATAVSAAAAAAQSAAAHVVSRGLPLPNLAAQSPLETSAAAPPEAAAPPRAATALRPPRPDAESGASGESGASDAGDASVFDWQPQVDDDMLELFFEEAAERLDGLTQKLVRLEDQPDDKELIRDVFRDLHTLKGSSGMVALAPMNRLAHAAEDLVGQVREGARRADRTTIDALLAALDRLRDIVTAARTRAPIATNFGPLVARLKDPASAAAPTALASPGASADPGGESGTAGRSPATDAGTVGRSPATDAGTPAAGAPAALAPAKHTLRVDFDKLDLLLNLVGELVLGKAGLGAGLDSLASLGRELENQRRATRRADPRRVAEELGRIERVFAEVSHDLAVSSGRLDHVAAELRDQVMKLRMVPIGGIFRKHHRTVRDLSQSLGKEVRLVLAGEDTELDKILVEQLEDPLMHLVRNAVDHGIEPPARRVAAGKPAEGTLRLSAHHLGNQIFIELGDDGGGIDPARLRSKAQALGLASAAELVAMDDREALELIFRAGFSTAARVSEVSGRGVGMDVVRDTVVKKLKGEIDVASVVGQGTTLTLRLPLTLAIIQVLLAGVGGDVFAIPLDTVTRTLTCAPTDLHRLADREVLAVQGRQVPIIRLTDVLELGSDGAEGPILHVVLIEAQGQPFGLVCDRLVGKQEIVIKSLADLLVDVPCAAGATLLGDRVALILDVSAVIQRAQRRGAAALGPPAAAAPVVPPPAAAPRILLVEDSDVIRQHLRRQLEAAGYHVVEARDGREGLDLARRERFDLVSTDVVMPRMDGYELTRALRAEAGYKDTPIIMVTSRGEKIDRVRGFDAGVDEYLTKPHDRNELIAAIAKHVRGRSGGGA